MHERTTHSPGVIDVVCGVIQDGGGKFLVCQRPDGKHLGGLWEFPGGKVEPGEAPADALARELREELGIEVAVGRALEAVIWQYERVTIRLMPFLCEISSGSLFAHEHVALRWCTVEEFAQLAWADADVPVLEQLARL